MTRRALIAGNWKMNTGVAQAKALVSSIVDAAAEMRGICDLAVFPPFPFLESVAGIASGSGVLVGAQDCAQQAGGAYTGDVSAPMIRDVGASAVILGHSERRQYHRETNEIIAQKAARAWENTLLTIICVGETWAEREAGRAQDIVAQQLALSVPEGANAGNTVIAYEPVWAIGTGKTATPDDAAAMHVFIRKNLGMRFGDYKKMRILYGGSMKPENARDLLAIPDVDGGLIGGASLNASDFLAIARAARDS